MMTKFDWQNLPKPFLALAPMEGVTDSPFRQVVAKAGKPDVFFTEFVSVEGFCSRGYPGMRESLLYTDKEFPLIAQIWGYTPELFYKTAKKLVDGSCLPAGRFSGIDINMGCPDKAVIKKGSGAALIDNQNLALKIIQAVKAGAAGKNTRFGENQDW